MHNPAIGRRTVEAGLLGFRIGVAVDDIQDLCLLAISEGGAVFNLLAETAPVFTAIYNGDLVFQFGEQIHQISLQSLSAAEAQAHVCSYGTFR